MKTNKCPVNASSARRSRTSACSPSKLLRISQVVRHKYTRTLAGSWIMRATPPTPCVTQWGLHRRRCAVARPSPAPAPDPPPLHAAAAPVLFHQRESHRLLFPQPFAPKVEGLFSKPLLFTKPLHRQAAALLLGDPFAPILASCLRLPMLALVMAPLCGLPDDFGRGVHRTLTSIYLWQGGTGTGAAAKPFPPRPFRNCRVGDNGGPWY